MIIGGIGTGINYNTKSIGYNGNFNYGIYPRQDKSIQQLLKKAGVGLALLPYKANGITKGINSPLTNPWVDLSGNANNALLTNFAGTTADGWDNQAILSSTGVDVDYENLVVNGDFSNGTTGWAVESTILSVVDGNLLITGNGSTATSGAFYRFNGYQPSNKRLTRKIRIRVKDASLSLQVFLRDGVGGTQYANIFIANPIVNQWYEIEVAGIATMGVLSNDLYLFTRASYTDAATQNGKMIEVDYVQLINLTDNPYVQAIEARLGRQLNKEECDRIFPFVVAVGHNKVGIMPFLKFDGVNSYGILPNNPSIDIVGLDEFEITKCFLTPSTLVNMQYIQKTLDGTDANTQIGIVSLNNGSASFILGGVGVSILSIGGLVPNTMYILTVKRKLGRLIVYLNGVEKYNQPNVKSITTQPNFRIGARPNIADGSTHTLYSNLFDGGTLITKNPQNWDALDKVTKEAFKGYY